MRSGTDGPHCFKKDFLKIHFHEPRRERKNRAVEISQVKKFILFPFFQPKKLLIINKITSFI